MVSSSVRGLSAPVLVAPVHAAEHAASFLSRVRDAEGAAFVGRREVLERLEAIVREADHEPRVVTVVGAPGLGKSATARALVRRLPGRRIVWIRGDHEGASPATFETAVARALDGGLDALGRGAVADLVIVDTFERCGEVGPWLFEEALRRAGPRLCVVLVSRERPPAGADAALMSLVAREVTVPLLADDEAAEYLTRRGVPCFAQPAWIDQAAGYPLVLKWMADKLLLGTPEASSEREVLAGAAAMFLADAPSPLHERALLALAAVDVLDEVALEAMLGCGRATASQLFAWLGGRAFVEVREGGLVPHTLPRSALYAKVLGAGAVHAELAARAGEVLLRRAAEGDADVAHAALMRALYTRRRATAALSALGAELAPRIRLRPATRAEVAPLAELVRRVEGEDSERRFRRAFALDRSLVWAAFGAHGEVLGLLGGVSMRGLPDDIGGGDRALEAAAAALRGRTSGASWDAVAVRWWMTSAGEPSRDPALLSLVTGALFLAARGAPRTRFVVVVAANEAEAEPWDLALDAEPREPRAAAEAVVSVGDLHRLVGAGAPSETVARLAKERLYALGGLDDAGSASGSPTLEALQSALRDALPRIHRPRELSASPLLGLRQVRGAGPACLVRVLVDSIEQLGAEPGYDDAARVLRVTYLGQARKQEAAAADLGLPFGTYRHRLRAAIGLLARAISEAEGRARAAR